MDKGLKVYFAGPDVFRSNPQEYFDDIEKRCVKYNIIPIFPYDSSFIKPDSIYFRNIELLNEADVILANITPFRGPSVDPGTAFEIGYAIGAGKPVVGYSNADITDYKERITEDIIKTSPEYPYVENFGLCDNLMIVCGCDFIYENIDQSLSRISTHYKWLLKKKLNG